MIKERLLFSILLFTLTINAYAQKKKEIVHYNIIFAPDLSNRLNPKLYPKNVNDADIVDTVLKNIWPILRIKRSDGQLDRYSVDFINKGLISKYNINPDLLTIDFKRFDKQNDRINYIMSRNGITRTLPADVSRFIAEYRKFNTKASVLNNGADIWTYFQSGIDDRIVLNDIIKEKIVHKFRNILILMTDGYIEAGIYNKGYDLCSAKVTEFRKAFLNSKETNMASFLNRNKAFKINPVNNAFLSNLEVIVVEMYDRSLSKTGAATKHPTDMEIMKVIWTDWLKSSGIKRFELKPIANTKAEVTNYIIDFIKK